MDRKTASIVIDDLISRLKTDLENLIPDVPEHWEEEELQWLIVSMAERMATSRDLRVRRRSFKHWIQSKHL